MRASGSSSTEAPRGREAHSRPSRRRPARNVERSSLKRGALDVAPGPGPARRAAQCLQGQLRRHGVDPWVARGGCLGLFHQELAAIDAESVPLAPLLGVFLLAAALRRDGGIHDFTALRAGSHRSVRLAMIEVRAVTPSHLFSPNLLANVLVVTTRRTGPVRKFLAMLKACLLSVGNNERTIHRPL